MSEGINIAEANDKGRALFMGIELLVAPGARPHFRAALAAARADEVRFDVGQPHMMGPAVGAERDVVAAAVVAAIDQHVADAGFAHLAEGDFALHGAKIRLWASPSAPLYKPAYLERAGQIRQRHRHVQRTYTI